LAVALLLATGCTGAIDQGDARQTSQGTSRGEPDHDSQAPADSADSVDPASNENPGDSSAIPDGSSASSGDGDTSSGGTPKPVDDDALVWRRANMTNFESYPDPGSEECIEYSGCDYVGQFAALDDTQSLDWVSEHNIAAVRFDHFGEYELKTLRLRSGDKTIDVVVYDECADTDCDGCCTENSSETGFLIDLEIHTADRFGLHDGIVEFACLDC
jgi:hypothetical protein